LQVGSAARALTVMYDDWQRITNTTAVLHAADGLERSFVHNFISATAPTLPADLGARAMAAQDVSD